MKQRISIAMTTYNSERFVWQQLESLELQKQPPDELVVSDDASTDRTVELVREFAQKTNIRVRLIAGDCNLGIARNLERAISKCEGDIIFLSDSDDYWYPEKTLVMERVLAETPGAALAVCNSDLVDEDLNPLGATAWETIDHFSPDRKLLSEVAMGKTYRRALPAGASCMAFRAKFRPLVLPLPGGEASRWHAHDHFIACVLICSGAGGAVLLPQPLLAYRQHPGQATHAAHARPSGGILSRLASASRSPYLLPLLIERLESDRAKQYCANPEIRSSALRHWRARVGMPPSFGARLYIVTRELAASRYHRFSGGAATAAKDLFFTRHSN